MHEVQLTKMITFKFHHQFNLKLL